MCPAAWAAPDRTSRSRIPFAFPPLAGTVPFWSLVTWLAARCFDCTTTSYLGCFIPLLFNSVSPQLCVLHWVASTPRARGLRWSVEYVGPSKIISVGVLSSCCDTTHLLGSQKSCGLCVFFFSSSSSYIVIELEPMEGLCMAYLAKSTLAVSSCPYMLGKEDVFC